MAVTNPAPFGVDNWGASGDSWPGREGWNRILQLLNTQAMWIGQGTLSSRPAAGIAHRAYWATDVNRLYYDEGTADGWLEVSPVGSGVAPPALEWKSTDQAAVVGTSRAAMRSDARPAIPAWPVQRWLGYHPYRAAGPNQTTRQGFAAGAETRLFSANFSACPTGTYLIKFTLVASTQSVAADAYTQNAVACYIQHPDINGGAEMVIRGGLPADLDRKRMPYVYEFGLDVPTAGKTLKATMSCAPTSVGGYAYTTGTEIELFCLGPGPAGTAVNG